MDTTFLGELFGRGQTYDLPIDWSGLFGGGWPDYMSDPGLASLTGGEQMYFDTVTGQLVTLAQAQAIDPTFQGISGAEPSTPQSGVNLPTGNQPSQAQMSMLEQILRLAPGTLSAVAGLGLLGGAGAG